MDSKRAQTLEALEKFIQAQRLLLDRTQSDIERLQELRNDAIAQPSHFLSDLGQKLDATAFRLSEQVDIRLALPQNIEWSVFDGHDPVALKTLALKTRQNYAQRNQPYLYQRSPLSDLQRLVKEARKTIVDPILAQLEGISEADDDPEEKTGIDPEEARREAERGKLRGLKRRNIQSTSGLKLPSYRARGPSGVFIRRDIDDESLEVDISLDDSPSGDTTRAPTLTDVDTVSTTCVNSQSLPLPLPPPISASNTRDVRIRRPSNKLRSSVESKKVVANSVPSRRKTKTSGSTLVRNEPEAETISSSTTSVPKRSRNADKPKPETYKLAWSVSEQHLLEQLLEQIPEGEKNRWQKISRAMDGRRTPRQVASRVQKYFEKLKRFGIREG